MQAGIVKVWNASAGYGFITPDNGVFDVFVHATAIESTSERTLAVGDRVQFELVSDERGRRAERVTRIPEETAL